MTSSLRRRAFTLIELLIVITIIGILAVALIPRLTGGPARARDAQRKSDLQQIATALEFYNQDNGEYPDIATPACVKTLSLSSYLTTIPSDPTNAGYGASCDGAANGGYIYYELDDNSDGTIDGYILIADLETVTETATTSLYNSTFTVPSATTQTFVEWQALAGVVSEICTNLTNCPTSGADSDRMLVVGR